MFYVFAGEARQSSVAEFCKQIAGKFSARCIVIEWDVLRQSFHNVLLGDNRQLHDWLIRTFPFDFYFNTPPCDSWCRAHFLRGTGPPPLRNRIYPLGFPWAKQADRLKLEVANDLNFFCWEACAAACEAGIDTLSEFPEDLGRRPQGFPASPFQLDAFGAFLEKTSATTGAMFQYFFPDTDVRKPTRWTGTLKALRNWKPLRIGKPVLDAQGWYKGPLPGDCGHRSHSTSVGKLPDGQFATQALGAYRPLLSHSLAELFWDSWHMRHPSGGGVNAAVPSARPLAPSSEVKALTESVRRLAAAGELAGNGGLPLLGFGLATGEDGPRPFCQLLSDSSGSSST